MRLAMFCLFLIPLALPFSPAFAGTYGLKVGDRAPAIDTTTVAGRRYVLAEEVKKGPVVLVFYRGGWCPFCNTQLHALESKVVPRLKQSGASLVGLSVDLPDEEAKTQKKHSLSFPIISDPKAVVLGLYNVKYHVPDELVSAYKTKYGIDLEAASGEKHHVIAVPAVYVIDGKGMIAYAFVDEDYKKRAPEDDVVKAAELAAAQKR